MFWEKEKYVFCGNARCCWRYRPNLCFLEAKSLCTCTQQFPLLTFLLHSIQMSFFLLQQLLSPSFLSPRREPKPCDKVTVINRYSHLFTHILCASLIALDLNTKMELAMSCLTPQSSDLWEMMMHIETPEKLPPSLVLRVKMARLWPQQMQMHRSQQMQMHRSESVGDTCTDVH